MSPTRRIQSHRLRGNRTWLIALAVVTLLSFTITLAPSLQAADAPMPVAGVAAQGQIFSDDFQVEAGEVVNGDVVVYSGDAKIESGGRLAGNLTVYSGDVEVEEGGVIDGSITSLNGDVQIDGTVGGSISSMSGDVELGDNAVVAGDISVVSGHIKERAGARVEGSLLRGPDIKWPFPPKVPGVPGLVMPEPTPPVREMSFGARIWDFFSRGLLAALLLGLAVGGAAATMALRPQWVDNVQATLRRQSALSFGAGLVINVVALAFIGILWITVCFRPPALLLGIGLAAVNIVGLAAIADEIGRRVAARSNAQWPPVANVALGVVIPGGVLALLWWLGGCFAFFAYLGALILGSFGLGALVARMLRLDTPQGPVGSATAPVPAPAAAPSTASAAPASAAPAATRAAEQPLVEPETTPTVIDPAPAVGDVDSISAPAAPMDAAPAHDQPLVAPVSTPPAPVSDSDLTRLPGIGPKLNQKLRDAGLRTFADVAARTPADLGAILDWSADRVVRSGLIEQAALLAANEQS